MVQDSRGYMFFSFLYGFSGQVDIERQSGLMKLGYWANVFSNKNVRIHDIAAIDRGSKEEDNLYAMLSVDFHSMLNIKQEEFDNVGLYVVVLDTKANGSMLKRIRLF